MMCKKPGCCHQRRVREDGSGYYDYCGKSCRDSNYQITSAGIIYSPSINSTH